MSKKKKKLQLPDVSWEKFPIQAAIRELSWALTPDYQGELLEDYKSQSVRRTLALVRKARKSLPASPELAWKGNGEDHPDVLLMSVGASLFATLTMLEEDDKEDAAYNLRWAEARLLRWLEGK